jgi:hypothetical protein
MATSFSYSGTGLQSAIQSGSGGIASGDSSVEVDSIPADIAAGDDVKVALGSASDWAAGNGETVYGTVGTIGGGANGGTDITGLTRGAEGTTAASWSEGDPVRVGVQGREDGGVDRTVLQSQVSTGRRLALYDDFNVPDQGANGYTLPSGQTLTVETGSASIDDGALRIDSGAVVTLPAPSNSFLMKGVIPFDSSWNATFKLFLEWVDANNNAYWQLQSNLLQFIEVVSGTSTQQKSLGTDNGAFRHPQPFWFSHSEGHTALRFTRYNESISASDWNSGDFLLDGTQKIGFGSDERIMYIDRLYVEIITGNEVF